MTKLEAETVREHAALANSDRAVTGVVAFADPRPTLVCTAPINLRLVPVGDRRMP